MNHVLKLENSEEVFPSSLDLFQLPPTDPSYESCQYIDYRPVAQFNDQSPIEFLIPSSSGRQYIDLKRSLLSVKLRIEKADGTPWDKKVTEDQPAFVNLPLHSIFSQVDVLFNKEQISQVTSNYQYKSLIETLLDFGEGSKKSQLQCEGFWKDSPSKMDSTGTLNSGLNQRRSLTHNSKVADFVGPLHVDVLRHDRLLLNGIEISLKLWQSHLPFCMMAAEGVPAFKLSILDVVYRVLKVTVSPAVILAHDAALQKSPALYPYQKNIVKTVNVPAGQYDVVLQDLFLGQVPSYLCLGLVSSKAYTGSFSHNPFNFQHYNISRVRALVDDQSVGTGNGFSFNLSDAVHGQTFEEALQMLYGNLGKYHEDKDLNIGREDWPAGYALITFATDNNHWDDSVLGLVKRGDFKLEIKFAEKLAESITLILYARFPALFSVDRARAVTVSA